MTEQEWLDEFSSNLVSMLKEANMSQRELADDCDLTEASISNYINARKIPGIKAMINIAYSLNCSLDELIDFGERII